VILLNEFIIIIIIIIIVVVVVVVVYFVIDSVRKVLDTPLYTHSMNEIKTF
jgi:hypothetical protein